MTTLDASGPLIVYPNYELEYRRALEVAYFYQNQCVELTEILEMFLMDADAKNTKAT